MAKRIEKTDNLTRFVRVIGNRVTDPMHVAKLMESIEKHNMLEYAPILVNSKWQVIDGQTRLEAARKLGAEVYFIMGDDLTLDDVVLLNTTTRAWRINDYLHSYVSRKVPAYVRVAEYAKKWGLTVANSIAILASDTDKHLQAPYIEFRTGQLKILGEDYADEFAAHIHRIRPYTVDGIWQNREFLQALKIIIYREELDVDELVGKLEAYGRPINREVNVKEYLRQIEDIWNRGQRRTIRFA